MTATNEHEQLLGTAAPMQPPLPRWAYGIVNPSMKFLLRSPLHGLLSKNLMLLIFDGRKSGKRYSIPVGYVEHGNTLTLFSHAKWARNFEGGHPVAVRLRGQLRRGTASIIHDQAVIRAALERMIDERGEQMAAMMGFIAPGTSGETRRLQLPTGTSFVRIDLQ